MWISPLEIQALLLSDCLLLLQRGPDDRLQLKYPSRWLGGGGASSGESKTFFSPLVKLDSLLVRSVAIGNIVLMFISSAPHPHPMIFNLAKLLFVSRQQSPLCDQHHREANLWASGWDAIREEHVRSFLWWTSWEMTKCLHMCWLLLFVVAAGRIYLKRPSQQLVGLHHRSVMDPFLCRELLPQQIWNYFIFRFICFSIYTCNWMLSMMFCLYFLKFPQCIPSVSWQQCLHR